MKRILELLAEQVMVSNGLAQLYGLDARRYAGEMRSEHRRDDHNLFWDAKMALEHRREAEEQISKLRAKFTINQKELTDLIGKLEPKFTAA